MFFAFLDKPSKSSSLSREEHLELMNELQENLENLVGKKVNIEIKE